MIGKCNCPHHFDGFEEVRKVKGLLRLVQILEEEKVPCVESISIKSSDNSLLTIDDAQIYLTEDVKKEFWKIVKKIVDRERGYVETNLNALSSNYANLLEEVKKIK